MANAFLKLHGCEVLPFSNCESALDHAKHFAVDAVICDVQLRNGSSGLEFYKQFRELQNTKDVLFAFMTGEAIQQIGIQELQSSKNVKVFLKPLSFSDVISFIESRLTQIAS